jgi:DNA processing protein
LALRDWLQLSLTDGIGPILTRRLIASAGSAEAACGADSALLRTIEGIGASKASAICVSLRQSAQRVDEEIDRASNAGARILCSDDEEYPPLLREIPDPPSVLYVRGTIEPRDLNGVAIVGSRKCSYYGREQAERFAALLAGAGFTVVSGGARGVDSSAHRGALSHPSGRTIAALGCGIDVVYPPENDGLFDQIAGRGALVSEFPMGSEPARENFPRRNRLISGMSRGVLIVEADQRSGALITARQAYDDQARPVFALPGRVDNPLSAGPHQLIRDGATLTTRLEDILDGLGPLPQSVGEPALFESVAKPAESLATAPPQIDLTDQQRLILVKMGDDESSVDRIIEETGLGAQIVLQELTHLSLKGLVQRTSGQVYLRRDRTNRR